MKKDQNIQISKENMKIIDNEVLKRVAKSAAKERNCTSKHMYRLGSAFIGNFRERMAEGEELPIGGFSKPKNIQCALSKKENGEVVIRCPRHKNKTS